MGYTEYSAPRLKKAIGPRQLFSLAFGSIIGVGWITAMGVWVGQAGAPGPDVDRHGHR